PRLNFDVFRTALVVYKHPILRLIPVFKWWEIFFCLFVLQKTIIFDRRIYCDSVFFLVFLKNRILHYQSVSCLSIVCEDAISANFVSIPFFAVFLVVFLRSPNVLQIQSCWLNDPINSDKVTISDTRIIDTDNRAAAILDITDEYANDHRGFLPGIDELNNEAISSYAHKVFKRTTKMETDRALAEWCEGTNIAAIFAKIPKRDVNPNSWEVLLEGLKAKNMSLDNLQMKPLKYKLNTKSAKELGSQAEEKLAEIIKIKKQQAPIEKIENAMLYRQILNICDQVNGETYSFYALLEATGFKPNKDRDQERAMDYIRECSSRK
ncbi:unnamed protein product, partial [Oikopleura dioica]